MCIVRLTYCESCFSCEGYAVLTFYSMAWVFSLINFCEIFYKISVLLRTYEKLEIDSFIPVNI